MSVEQPNRMFAQAIVESGVAPAFRVNAGFSAIIRNGVGDYTLLYDQQLTDRTAHFELGLRDTPAATSILPLLDATGVQILTDLGGPADIDFAITVFAFGEGTV